ncbi:MAG: 50S ribosomal protein L23 [Patescibacteria group bacterium]
MTQEEKKKDVLETGNIAYRVLAEPWVTEESTRLMELNKYIFKVFKRATKKEVERAVKEIYKVEPISVNTVNMPRKFRVQGKIAGWKSGFKKAIVTLKEGDKIDFYEK